MASTLNLFTRLTHQYQGGWSHLDDSELVGTVKQLAVSHKRIPDDYDDGGSVKFRIVAPSKLKGVNLSRAIADTHTYNNCRHDYDCCGCQFSRAEVLRISPREYAVHVTFSYNL